MLHAFDPCSLEMTTAKSTVKPGEVVGEALPKLASGRGIRVVDVSGKEYLDGSGGPAVLCLSHPHPEVNEVNEAIRRQLDDGSRRLGITTTVREVTRWRR